MELHLDGRVAVVTGGSSGIGLATCRLLLEEGAALLRPSAHCLASRAEFYACWVTERAAPPSETAAIVDPPASHAAGSR